MKTLFFWLGWGLFALAYIPVVMFGSLGLAGSAITLNKLLISVFLIGYLVMLIATAYLFIKQERQRRLTD